MAEYDLEDAIKLSEDCCRNKDLVLYGVGIDLHYGGDDFYLVCANCRTKYRWVEGEREAWKFRFKMNDDDLYKSISYHSSYLAEVSKHHQGLFDKIVKKLRLDKDKLEKVFESWKSVV